jgi:hypothetical protein
MNRPQKRQTGTGMCLSINNIHTVTTNPPALPPFGLVALQQADQLELKFTRTRDSQQLPMTATQGQLHL